MSNELTLASQSQTAEYFYKSGLFPDIKSQAQAFVKIKAGEELGIKPFQAMQGIDVIQGKVSIKPVLMGALIKQSAKYDYKLIESTKEVCKIEFFEKDGDHFDSLGISEVTIQEMSEMGLSGKDNYKKQPKTMLFWRAMSKGSRQFTPDITMMPVYSDFDEIQSENDIEISLTPLDISRQLVLFCEQIQLNPEKAKMIINRLGYKTTKDVPESQIDNVKMELQTEKDNELL